MVVDVQERLLPAIYEQQRVVQNTVRLIQGAAVLQVPPERKAALQNLPIWAFHGGKDSNVPVTGSQQMVEAFRKLGASDVKLTIFPNSHHDIWSKTYDDPQLYDWLLKHRRPTGGPSSKRP